MSAEAPSAPAPAPRRGGSFVRGGRRIVRYVLAFVTAVLVIDAVVGEKGLLALVKARRDFEGIEVALAQARAENARLREEARRLREDPSAIEEIARRELGLIKPGETLFIIKDVAPRK